MKGKKMKNDCFGKLYIFLFKANLPKTLIFQKQIKKCQVPIINALYYDYKKSQKNILRKKEHKI